MGKKHAKMSLNFRTVKMLIFIFIDIAVINALVISGYLIDLGSLSGYDYLFSLMMSALHVVVFAIFNCYWVITDRFSSIDAFKFGLLIIATNAVGLLLNLFVPIFDSVSPITIILVTGSECLCIIGSRCVQSLFRFYRTSDKNYARTMIVGAGSCAKIAFDEIHQNTDFHNNVICFIDDDPEKIGKRYLNKPIVGPISNIKEYIEKYDIKEIIVAINRIDKDGLKKIISYLKDINSVKVRRMPILSEINDPTKKESLKIKEVSLTELLGREQITFDTQDIEKFLKGKRVMITGGGGSIGSELARQCYKFGVKELLLFDIYENAVYNIQMELVRKMKQDNSDMVLNTIIGSTYNEFRMEEMFIKYKPEIVFHAAAYKHVPLMEDSPVEAIRTNCLGTYITAKLADKYNVEKMVLVSTDKAVRPTNTMGATKAFAEMIIRYWNNKSENTSYSAVRFGNVLGSNGSVIPLFKSQIAEGGPVTVTDPEIIRYFMTIPEAVSLILQSGAFAKGGEIFILDMGEPVKILTLAENVIRQCGYTPYKDIDIVFTGLRPGEKLFEELLIDVTKNTKTSNSKIFVEEPKKILPMDENIEFISKVFNMTDNDEIKNTLRQVVTSYTDYEEFNKKSKEQQNN